MSVETNLNNVKKMICCEAAAVFWLHLALSVLYVQRRAVIKMSFFKNDKDIKKNINNTEY